MSEENTRQDDLALAAEEKPISKSQMKKIARKQRILELRPEKRKLEKERRRQRRQEQAKLREQDGHVPVSTEPKKTLMKDSDNKFRIVIDMDFEDFMTADEIAKAAKQVGRVYALNRRSKRPCQLYITSLRGKIRDRFGITCPGYKSWDANMFEEDYLDAIPLDHSDENTSSDDKRNEIKNNVIYLTGDTDDDLPDVRDLLKDESKIFVIGGLVDHNRHKDLCFRRAQERGIKTARLPIKQYVKLCQRHILSTVTVFEIMLNVLACGDPWPQAFLKSIPQRKIEPKNRNEEPALNSDTSINK